MSNTKKYYNLVPKLKDLNESDVYALNQGIVNSLKLLMYNRVVHHMEYKRELKKRRKS